MEKATPTESAPIAWLTADEIAAVKKAASDFLDKKFSKGNQQRDEPRSYGLEINYVTPMKQRLVANAANETKSAVNGLIDEMASDKAIAEGILDSTKNNRNTLMAIRTANNLAYRKFTGISSEGRLETSSVDENVRNAFENLVAQALDAGFKALPEEKRVSSSISENLTTGAFTSLVRTLPTSNISRY